MRWQAKAMSSGCLSSERSGSEVRCERMALKASWALEMSLSFLSLAIDVEPRE